MALVRLQPSSDAVNNTTTLPQALTAPNSSTFTSLYPESKVDSLLKYVEGYPWTVHYYGQIVNVGDTLEHIDPGTPSFNQPYYEVLDAILQVSSPLTSSYDETTSLTTVTGTALVPFKITPNVADLFIAQVDSGEDAYFIVNSVYRKTHRKETLYEINYSLYQYTSSNPALGVQLKERVQDSYHFNQDSQYYNRDNLIAPQEHQSRLTLRALVNQSQSYYFERFVKKASGTLLVPGTEHRCYDPYLLQFISKTVGHDSIGAEGLYQHTQFERYAKQPVFWDLLTSRDAARLFSLNRKVGFASSASMRNHGRVGTVFHAGIDFMASAIEPQIASNITDYPDRQPEIWHRAFLNDNNSFVYAQQVRTVNNQTDLDKRLLHPLFAQDSYVVSEHFYRYLVDRSDFADISYVEWTLARFIRRDAMDKQDVVRALESYGQWSVVHQFYLLPALWLVAKAID